MIQIHKYIFVLIYINFSEMMRILIQFIHLNDSDTQMY